MSELELGLGFVGQGMLGVGVDAYYGYAPAKMEERPRVDMTRLLVGLERYRGVVVEVGRE